MLPDVATNPSIFLRLKQTDESPREIAWEEFHKRYAPIVSAFAGRLGAKPQDVDDVVQDVMIGFYSKSPTFVYDPAKGRFRGYLKVCTCHAVAAVAGKAARLNGVSLDQINPDAVAVEQAWNDVWEEQLVQSAIDEIRDRMGQTKTFQAFEQYVAFDQPAQAVAEKLGVHITTVYKAKEQITRMLRERVRAMDDCDG